MTGIQGILFRLYKIIVGAGLVGQTIVCCYLEIAVDFSCGFAILPMNKIAPVDLSVMQNKNG